MTRFFSRAIGGVWIVVFMVACGSTKLAVADQQDSIPQRILFIGNSYTNQIKESLVSILKNSPYDQTKIRFVTVGGATLQQHLVDENTIQYIQNGKWDLVVLQEQSQMPALPGKFGESFQRSVDTFSKLIRAAGAEPVLFMTWGRRDGDQGNREIFPHYEAMQKKIAGAYQAAAKRNGMSLVSVGLAWSEVMQRDKKLGNSLYQADGSHPSDLGASLSACVFFRVLFGDSLNSVKPPTGPSSRHWKILKEAALNVPL